MKNFNVNFFANTDATTNANANTNADAGASTIALSVLCPGELTRQNAMPAMTSKALHMTHLY